MLNVTLNLKLRIGSDVFFANDNTRKNYIRFARGSAPQRVECNLRSRESDGAIVLDGGPLMFAIPAGTLVDRFIIGTNDGIDADVCTLLLEGDEIVQFTQNGTYVIDSLEIRVRGTV